MRFEIKYTKMQKLNERGIYNLQDLANYGLHNFKDELLNEFNNILFYDNTIQSKSQSILHYKNALYWIELLSKKRNDLFNYHRNQLRKLTSTTSQKIQLQTADIMSKTIDLLNTNTTQIDSLPILSERVVLTNDSIKINSIKSYEY
jgi:predicted NodU family carbamoyl transferase